MKKKGKQKPKPFPKLTEKQQEELLEFLQSAHGLPSPSAESIAARMQELEEMGLEDLPEYEGISSSVRQYAINSLAMGMAKAAGDELATGDDREVPVMVTFDKQLLAKADQLAARFGLKPMHPAFLPTAVDSREIN
ncbi:MAG: hypothetical protein ACE5JX_21260 [Acidobacteriota bacterium]